MTTQNLLDFDRVQPVDPHVPAEDVPRLTKQALAILARLRRGPATNVELSAIGLRFGARLMDMRRAGYEIESVRGAGGLWTYSLNENKMMRKVDRDDLLDRMIRNVQRTIRKVSQLIMDAEWWNANRPDAPPFDVGTDKAVLSHLRKHLAELRDVKRSHRKIDGRWIQRIIESGYGHSDEEAT